GRAYLRARASNRSPGRPPARRFPRDRPVAAWPGESVDRRQRIVFLPRDGDRGFHAGPSPRATGRPRHPLAPCPPPDVRRRRPSAARVPCRRDIEGDASLAHRIRIVQEPWADRRPRVRRVRADRDASLDRAAGLRDPLARGAAAPLPSIGSTWTRTRVAVVTPTPAATRGRSIPRASAMFSLSGPGHRRDRLR